MRQRNPEPDPFAPLDLLISQYKKLADGNPDDMQDVWHGHYRTLTFYGSDHTVTHLTGSSSYIDDQAASLERTDWAAIEDTSDLTGPQQLPPDILQTKRVWPHDFTGYKSEQQDVQLRVADLVGALGLHTYADILALGKGGLEKQTKAIDVELTDQHVRLLAAIVFRETGHILPEKHAKPRGLHEFYTNIAHASPAIALPFSSLRYYGDLGTGHQQETIGSLRSAPGVVTARYIQASRAGAKLFKTFLNGHIMKTIVEPFVASGQGGRIPQQRN